ncbi:MAG: hypothetical protein AAGB23_09850 [Pseudomonadota bacterium]
MSAVKQHPSVQHSEELYDDKSIQAGFDLDVLQYESRDYSFLDKDFLWRSAKRLKKSAYSEVTTKVDLSPAIHPLDSETLHRQRLAEEDLKREILNFPEVFKTRVFGERSVSTLQEWECVVETVEDGVVISTALSLLDEAPEEQSMSIPLTEFAPTDRKDLRRGVIFRVIIGLSKKASGARSREAICYLRKSRVNSYAEAHSLFDGL